MRSIIIGIVIGCVVGVMFGTTVIAPRLEQAGNGNSGQNAKQGSAATIGEAIEQAAHAIIPANPVELPPAGHQRTIVRWRMASAWPDTLPLLGKLASRIGRNLWNVSDGGFEIKISRPTASISPGNMFDAVSSGTIDSAFGPIRMWADKAPVFEFFAGIPFGPQADEYLAWMYFGGGQKILNETYRKFNVHGILCGLVPSDASGWYRRRFTNPDDLKGLKMRTSGLGARVLEKLGVQPLKLDDAEIFTAFENGDIDAAEFSLPSIDLKLGLHDVAGHYYFPGWQQPASFHNLIINEDKWAELSKSQQSQLEAVCGDNVRHGLAEGGALQYGALKEITAKNVKIHRWPDSILSALKSAWQDVRTEQSTADSDFRRAWKSLEEFRNGYSTWKELSKP